MSLGTPAIIVLEDNHEDFVVLEMACEELDRPIKLIRFHSAEQLIDEIHKESFGSPALFLIDLRMPGHGGITALKTIKKHPLMHVTPCVVVSTSTNPQDIFNCYQSGASAFHEKLIETPRMIERLKTVLRYWLDEAILAPTRRTETHA